MKKLSLEDKNIVDSFYRRSGVSLGYDSFAGEISVAHGHKHNVCYDILEDSLFYIEEYPEDGQKSLIPVFLDQRLKERKHLIREYIKDQEIDSLVYIDSSLVKDLESILDLEPDSDSEHEVIYPIERFKDFREIDSQRRQANIFFRSNNYSFSRYDPKNKNSVIRLAKNWEQNSLHPTDGGDVRITEFLTKNFDVLDIIGFHILVGSEVKGYIFGEKINNKTFVIYSIKANRKYKGIYQAMLNLTCSHPLLEDVDFINNTNLTEVKGLRESKLRLKPGRIIVPWVANLPK